MDGPDLLGLLFSGEDQGCDGSLFPVENDLIESWLSEQDVRLLFEKLICMLIVF